jgi:hypothetical protein
VPAGTFKAMRVEINSNRAPTGKRCRCARVNRCASFKSHFGTRPTPRARVKAVRRLYSTSGIRLDEDTYELLKYRLQVSLSCPARVVRRARSFESPRPGRR